MIAGGRVLKFKEKPGQRTTANRFTPDNEQPPTDLQRPTDLRTFARAINTAIVMDDFTADVEKSLEVLKQGGVILYPTDTVWGLGCDATNEAAVEKIFAIKQRPAAKSLIVLVADEREVLQYVAGPDLQVFDYLQSAAKPTTVIYEGAIGLAGNVINDDGSIGIRIVNEPFCRHLIRRFRKPVVSTSANTSGQPTPRVFDEIPDLVKESVDYIVHYRRNDNQVAAPSAVIKWKNGLAEIIRP